VVGCTNLKYWKVVETKPSGRYIGFPGGDDVCLGINHCLACLESNRLSRIGPRWPIYGRQPVPHGWTGLIFLLYFSLILFQIPILILLQFLISTLVVDALPCYIN
jgi:hypothetical protein